VNAEYTIPAIGCGAHEAKQRGMQGEHLLGTVGVKGRFVDARLQQLPIKGEDLMGDRFGISKVGLQLGTLEFAPVNGAVAPV
jgi:hypothetical protein